MVTLVRPLQPLKAANPMVVTESGMDTVPVFPPGQQINWLPSLE